MKDRHDSTDEVGVTVETWLNDRELAQAAWMAEQIASGRLSGLPPDVCRFYGLLAEQLRQEAVVRGLLFDKTFFDLAGAELDQITRWLAPGE